MKQLLMTLLLALALALGACSGASSSLPPSSQEPPASSQPAEEEPASQEEAPPEGPVIQEIVPVEGDSQNPSSCGVPIYIGTDGDFAVYRGSATSQPSPEDLIQAIAQLTGWNLTLAQPVEVVEDGYALVFTDDCSLVAGPPDPQKEEFHMFDSVQMVETALDSIRQTLRAQSAADGFSDPDQVQIYVSLEGGREVSLPEAGIRVPADQPYDGVVPLSE